MKKATSAPQPEKTRITINLDLTREQLQAVAFVHDLERGVYKDPRKPRVTNPAAAQPEIAAMILETALFFHVVDALGQARSHDQMVAANTRIARQATRGRAK